MAQKGFTKKERESALDFAFNYFFSEFAAWMSLGFTPEEITDWFEDRLEWLAETGSFDPKQ